MNSLSSSSFYLLLFVSYLRIISVYFLYTDLFLLTITYGCSKSRQRALRVLFASLFTAWFTVVYAILMNEQNDDDEQ